MRSQNESYHRDGLEQGPHNTNLDIHGGIMQNYRKVSGQSLDEVMNSDYWDHNKKLGKKASTMFNNVSDHESDMMNFTKNYTMRQRLNRDLEYSEDFRNQYMTKEYGNYDKYEHNKVDTVTDEGPKNLDKDKFYENYMNMIKKLPTQEAATMNEAKRLNINDMLTGQQASHREFGQ
jgi:hypothetical protein